MNENIELLNLKELMNYSKLKKELLKMSYENNLSHLPSSLSVLRYLSILIPLFQKKYQNFDWVAGKQFGQQAYYVIYKILNRNDLIPLNISENYKPLLTNSINNEFVFIEETLGNSLGVAIGLALSQTNPIWINLSDSVFQMGRIQEALRIITQFNLNIFITIDGNKSSRCTDLSNSKSYYGNKNPLLYIKNLAKTNNIPFFAADAFKDNNFKDIYKKAIKCIEMNGPRILYFNTIKGNGVEEFETNSVNWHYKKMTEEEYNKILNNKNNFNLEH